MGRPSKSTDVLAAEGASHRTKAELEQRKAAEEASLTGIKIRKNPQVKNDKNAVEEFKRVCKLLELVGKNDALFEATINDYCLLKSDIFRLTKLRSQLENDYENLENANMDHKERIKLRSEITKNMLSCDKQIASLRKKRFEIEKEFGFTLASALRAIPKKVEPKKSALLEALNGSG